MTGPEKPKKYRRFRIPENDAGSKHARLTVYEHIINTLSRQLIATDHKYNIYKYLQLPNQSGRHSSSPIPANDDPSGRLIGGNSPT